MPKTTNAVIAPAPGPDQAQPTPASVGGLTLEPQPTRRERIRRGRRANAKRGDKRGHAERRFNPSSRFRG